MSANGLVKHRGLKDRGLSPPIRQNIKLFSAYLLHIWIVCEEKGFSIDVASSNRDLLPSRIEGAATMQHIPLGRRQGSYALPLLAQAPRSCCMAGLRRPGLPSSSRRSSSSSISPHTARPCRLLPRCRRPAMCSPPIRAGRCLGPLASPPCRVRCRFCLTPHG